MLKLPQQIKQVCPEDRQLSFTFMLCGCCESVTHSVFVSLTLSIRELSAQVVWITCCYSVRPGVSQVCIQSHVVCVLQCFPLIPAGDVFVYTENRRGDRTQPWWIPVRKVTKEVDLKPFTNTCCSLSFNNKIRIKGSNHCGFRKSSRLATVFNSI